MAKQKAKPAAMKPGKKEDATTKLLKGKNGQRLRESIAQVGKARARP